jgi:hypothetical protein
MKSIDSKQLETGAPAVFFDPMYTLRQLLRAIPQPGRRSVGPATTPSGTTAVGYGCCPACHEFVSIPTSGPSASAACPSCGRPIRSLDALGSPGSLGATDEPWTVRSPTHQVE